MKKLFIAAVLFSLFTGLFAEGYRLPEITTLKEDKVSGINRDLTFRVLQYEDNSYGVFFSKKDNHNREIYNNVLLELPSDFLTLDQIAEIYVKWINAAPLLKVYDANGSMEYLLMITEDWLKNKKISYNMELSPRTGYDYVGYCNFILTKK